MITLPKNCGSPEGRPISYIYLEVCPTGRQSSVNGLCVLLLYGGEVRKSGTAAKPPSYDPLLLCD